MMILLKDLDRNEYYLNIDLIEAIYEHQGDTSEIVLVNGERYSCVESPIYVSNKINLIKIANQPKNIQST